MENLKDYIRELLKIKEELELKNLSDDMIVDVSVRIMNSQTINERENKKIIDNKISFAQQEYLKKLGYKGDFENMTKLEGIKMIEELKKKKYKENNEGII